MFRKQTQNLESTKERTYFKPMKIKFTWEQLSGGNTHILFIGDHQHCVATINKKNNHWYVKPNKFIKGYRKNINDPNNDYKYSPQLSLEETKDHVEEKLKDFLQSLESK